MSGPWIQTVVLWEHAEGDIVDGIAVEQGAQVNLTMMIALVRGDWQGAITLSVQAYDPIGDPIAAMEVEGDPPAIPWAVSKIVAPIELVPTQPGVYWFDVRNADVTITRVPLRIDWRA
jgi:hypothetical protein